MDGYYVWCGSCIKGEDAMTTELKDFYKKLVEANTDNPITVLCEKFPNFPQDSIRSIIENNNETIKFISF